MDRTNNLLTKQDQLNQKYNLILNLNWTLCCDMYADQSVLK